MSALGHQRTFARVMSVYPRKRTLLAHPHVRQVPTADVEPLTGPPYIARVILSPTRS